MNTNQEVIHKTKTHISLSAFHSHFSTGERGLGCVDFLTSLSATKIRIEYFDRTPLSMSPATSIPRSRSAEDKVIEDVAILLPRIARSGDGLLVAIQRGQRTMSVREENGKNEVESGMHCLMAQPHVMEKPHASVNYVEFKSKTYPSPMRASLASGWHLYTCHLLRAAGATDTSYTSYNHDAENGA